MAKVKPLPPNRLRATLDPARIPYEDSNAVPATGYEPPQPRALKALELALSIPHAGYNVYLCGEPNLGRTYLARNWLAPRAARAKTPPDVVYLFNFQDQDRPIAAQLPAGRGRDLKHDLAQAVSRIKREIPLRFEQEAYLKKRGDLMGRFQDAKNKLLGRMEAQAAKEGFNLDLDEQGALTLYPLVEGKLLSEEEFERLDPDLRKTLKDRSERLLSEMTAMLRRINREEQGLRQDEQSLDKEVVGDVLKQCLDPLARRFGRIKDAGALRDWFRELREDVLDNLDQFAPREPPQASGPGQEPLPPQGQSSDFFVRYEVNLFVDNSRTKGAPVVVEDHPTAHNLLGCIEREAEMGALITDFTLIKAGSLHRANHGFLLLHMEDLLQNPSAWEGLLRCLRSGLARIEDPGDGQEQTKTKTIEPEPVAMDCKVLLIGTDDTYELLLAHDDRFPKLFKIKAHLQETVHRDAASIRAYLRPLARIIREAGLPPFDRSALAWLVDHASRLAEDQDKLSLRMSLLRELMIEAAALARARGAEAVDAARLRQAERDRAYRSNLYEDAFMEEYDRELIKVATSGTAVGRVNGLSVTWFGDYEFGLPHQIACTVGVGYGGVVDLEREAMLGGPIHTKAMMILKSRLLDLFAQDKPLVLAGSLCFEQSYAHVEGDSASGAELAALISALAGVPASLSLAFTGAVNQSGEIMAVGGATRKVEGFFQVCRRRGLTGSQGVLVPADNVHHLMLEEEVVQAVADGAFHVYPIRHIDQALELLTGLPAGRRGKSGRFTAGSIYRLVDERLAEMGRLAERDFKGRGPGRRR